MLELRGQFNTAKVFTDNIDSETISQVIQLMNMPYMADCQTRIMPDCHAGAGCVVGTTIQLKDKVVPNLVGVDIGCGMLAIRLNGNIDLEKIDSIINEKVPSGFSIHERPIVKYDPLKDIIAPIDIEHANKSIGSLGGGNHFIEIDKDNDGRYWLVIHSGSRHLGIEVCKHYQKLAVSTLRNNEIDSKINSTIARLKAEGKQKDIENTVKILRMQKQSIPDDLCYIEGENFSNYIHDMGIAQNYAKLNRRTMADIIIKAANLVEIESFDTIHNYINMDDMILRKGSISARKGEVVIIPMNMRDGSLICIGKGNPDWNYSAPHGAGRILSRSAAKESVSFEDFRESMRGIYSTSVVESTIDEAPAVYKPMEQIIENIQDTVEIIDNIKPVYNFKAH